LIQGIRVCGEEGKINRLWSLLEENGLSEAVKKEIEPALILGIGVCARDGRIASILALLEKGGLSDNVRKTAENALGKGAAEIREKDMLLSDTIRPPARQKERQVSPEDKLIAKKM